MKIIKIIFLRHRQNRSWVPYSAQLLGEGFPLHEYEVVVFKIGKQAVLDMLPKGDVVAKYDSIEEAIEKTKIADGDHTRYPSAQEWSAKAKAKKPAHPTPKVGPYQPD